MTQIAEGSRNYLVVFPDGAGFNPGYRLVGDQPDYPDIADDYRRTHHFLEMLKPDMWFAQHTEYFDMAGKYAHMAEEGSAVWIDPEGYRRFIAQKKRAFEDEIDRQFTSQPIKQGTP
ncbi:hypothetical protein D3C76_1483610 [compost metagenome]